MFVFNFSAVVQIPSRLTFKPDIMTDFYKLVTRIKQHDTL
jgi:hypothetical protein